MRETEAVSEWGPGAMRVCCQRGDKCRGSSANAFTAEREREKEREKEREGKAQSRAPTTTTTTKDRSGTRALLQ